MNLKVLTLPFVPALGGFDPAPIVGVARQGRCCGPFASRRDRAHSKSGRPSGRRTDRAESRGAAGGRVSVARFTSAPRT
jgi:hypothetical protein